MMRKWLLLLALVTWGEAFAQTSLSTSGACSPALQQSKVTGDITIKCGASSEDLKSIARTLSSLSRDSALSRSQVDRLLGLLNDVIAPNTQKLLDKLQSFSRMAVDGNELLDEIEAWKYEVLAPKTIDPSTFIRVVPMLNDFRDSGRCYISARDALKGASPEEREWMAKGKGHLEEGLYQQAVAEYLKAIDLSPRDPSAYFSLGATYCRARQYEAAIASFRKASQLDPTNPTPLIAAGGLQARFKSYAESIDFLIRAEPLAPDDPAIPEKQGALWASMGNYKKSIEAYSRAIAIDPQYDDAYIGRAHSKIASHDAAGAASDLLAACALSKDNSMARRDLAHAYRMLAADPMRSRRTDYTSYADSQEQLADALDRTRSQRNHIPKTLHCGPDVDEGPGAAQLCVTETFKVYFARDSDYLDERGRQQIVEAAQRASECTRGDIGVDGFSDFGEDDASEGMDLSAARAFRVGFALFSASRGGAYSFGMGTGKGHKDLPVEASATPQSRNQVVILKLECLIRKPPGNRGPKTARGNR